MHPVPAKAALGKVERRLVRDLAAGLQAGHLAANHNLRVLWQEAGLAY